MLEEVVVQGLAAGALTVILVASLVGEKVRGFIEPWAPKWVNYLLSCTLCSFCTNLRILMKA